MQNYLVTYERRDGEFTKQGSAETPELFVRILLEGDLNITRIVFLEVEGGPGKPNRPLAVRKYNTWIRQGIVREFVWKENDPDFRRQEEKVMQEVAYRRGYHQSVACVVGLLEGGATLADIKRWERILRAWRSDRKVMGWVAYLNHPDMEKLPDDLYVDERPEQRFPELDKGK